ncbi:MAG: two-component sensor histidine kinase [Chitinophagaceae bacterium]|nr:two-component sensor histidine kinase [Chitinophagaceae bacterium]
MKLINYTLLYTSIALLFIVGGWAGIFYVNMLDEIYDSIDDGLSNSKLLIIKKAQTDSTLLHKKYFGESNYSIQQISAENVSAVRDLYKDTLMYMDHEEEYEPVRLLTTTFSVSGNTLYELKIISSMVEEDDLIEDLLYAVLWLYVVLIVSVVVVNIIVLRKVWKPFYRLIDYLQQYRLGGESDKVPVGTTVREFRLLSETVSVLLERNLEVYNSQKQFIENASHELQTPLAISINKLELLAERSDVSEEQLQTIGHVIQSLERLTRLNKSLLLLSKIENKQFAVEETINFNGLVKKVMEDFIDLAEFKEVKLVCHEEGELVRYMNKDLAEILLTNLLKNAVVHNVPGGTVDITVQKDSFTIVNTGAPKALNEEKLFSRFYKESIEKGTTGLGLSIVKAILDLYKGSVTYTFSGKHIMVIHI